MPDHTVVLMMPHAPRTGASSAPLWLLFSLVAGAPDAPDALQLGPPTLGKFTPYHWKRVFGVRDALPDIPGQKRRSDDAGPAVLAPRKANYSFRASPLTQGRASCPHPPQKPDKCEDRVQNTKVGRGNSANTCIIKLVSILKGSIALAIGPSGESTAQTQPVS